MKHISNFLYIIFILYINKIYCEDISKITVKGSKDSSDESIKKAKDNFKSLKSKCENMDNENMIKCLMSTYLNVLSLNPDGFCKSDDEYCKKSVKSYSDRCSSDQDKCHLLNRYKLVSLSKGDIYVPNLIQAEAANYVFKKSGARKILEFPTCLCVGECNCDCDCKTVECEYRRDIMSFNKTIVARNMHEIGVEGSSDMDLLEKFVYLSCLYYNSFYLYEDSSNSKCSNRNLQPTLRYSRSYKTRKKFSKMRRHSGMRIFVPYNEIQILFDKLVIYLTDRAFRNYKHMALSFVKVFRYTLIKSVPYYKHSYLFSYYLQKNEININLLCDKNSPNGLELFTEFLKTCKEEGECYLFHDYKLFSDDSPVNYLVPQLSEVNLVYYLLKHIKYKYGKCNSFFTNCSRPHAEIQYMAPRLLTINKQKFDEKADFTHKIIQAFLYYSAIYFVRTYREWWTTRQFRHIAHWDVENKLKAMLQREARGASLVIDDKEIKKIFPAFKEYLSNSYFKTHPNRVKRYSGIVEKVLMAYYNGESSTGCCIKF